MDGAARRDDSSRKSANDRDVFGATVTARAAPVQIAAQNGIYDLGYAPNPVALEGRQREVAQLIALGLADKEIAYHLGVSQGTVKGHVSAILRQLGLYRRTQICRYVHESGAGLTR